MAVAAVVAAGGASARQAPAAGELERVRLGRGESMPRLERQTLPAYPADRSPVPVAVRLEVVVGTSGRVLHARAVAERAEPAPDAAALADASIAALREWRFRPAEYFGRPEPSLVGIAFEFVPPAQGERAGRVLALVSALPRAPAPRPGGFAGVESTLDLMRASLERLADPSIGRPVPVRSVMPEYTAAAARAGRQGRVALEVIVGPDGTVSAASILESLDAASGLDGEALIAARYWLFAPATHHGRPVASRIRLVLEFTLH